jgi:hypothetical protein
MCNNDKVCNDYCKCKTFFHKNFRKYLTNVNPFFDLGYILLICSIGGILFDSLEYFFNKYSSLVKSNVCCLYHLLIQIEDKYFNDDGNKLKISNFINTKYFSDNFIQFLCFTLRFDKNVSNSEITNHPWLKISNYIELNNYFNKVKVNMKEIIKISREVKRSVISPISNTNSNEKKYHNFLNNFEIIISNNKFIRKDHLISQMIIKKCVYKEISKDLGVNVKDLINKLEEKILQGLE